MTQLTLAPPPVLLTCAFGYADRHPQRRILEQTKAEVGTTSSWSRGFGSSY